MKSMPETVIVNGKLKRVVVAISAFRSNQAVLQVLEDIFSQGEHPFAAVVVVDSLADGALELEFARRGWNVCYDNANVNLGSAGNFARRLQIAAEYKADWCYAINHDGYVDPNIILRMLSSAEQETHVGAVYPALYTPSRDRKWEGGRTSIFMKTPPTLEERPPQTDSDVVWGSSNSALYSLAMVRSGTTVWADLWMGWEDLHYGMRMRNAGWRQRLCGHVVFVDSYEYRPVSFLGRKVYVTDKPAWYAYYGVRNQIAIERIEKNGLRGAWSATLAVVRELLLVLAVRQQKLARLQHIFSGVRDGLIRRMGKGPVP